MNDANQLDDPALRALATDLGHALGACGRNLATAESCTGGWVAKALTDCPGSSAHFVGGIVSYSDDVKREMLGVSAETLKSHGAVSEATAVEMAHGALEICGANVAVAISGVAGPGGEVEGKPVGTVCFGWAWREEEKTGDRAETRWFAGDREAVRRASVAAALQGTTALVRPWSDGG